MVELVIETVWVMGLMQMVEVVKVMEAMKMMWELKTVNGSNRSGGDDGIGGGMEMVQVIDGEG